MKTNNNTVAAIIIIIAMVISQITIFNKIENLENQNMTLQNILNGVQSSISQQNYMISTEKVDYLISEVSCENVKINKKSAVLNLNMSISFDKLPSDSVISLEYRGTTNHFPSIKMEPFYSAIESVDSITYGDSQTTVMQTVSANKYNSELNLDLGQNYEFAIVIETKVESFREIIGVIPALEWSEPNYAVQVEMHELSVSTPDNGRFDYTAKLTIPPLAYDLYDMPYGKVLYNFENLENNIAPKITSVNYMVFFSDDKIDEGELSYVDRASPEVSDWEISDVTKFKADIQSDYIKALRVDFVIQFENGRTAKSTWWADGMSH